MKDHATKYDEPNMENNHNRIHHIAKTLVLQNQDTKAEVSLRVGRSGLLLSQLKNVPQATVIAGQ